MGKTTQVDDDETSLKYNRWGRRKRKCQSNSNLMNILLSDNVLYILASIMIFSAITATIAYLRNPAATNRRLTPDVKLEKNIAGGGHLERDGALYTLVANYVESQVQQKKSRSTVQNEVNLMLNDLVDQNQAQTLVEEVMERLDERRHRVDRFIREFEDVVTAEECKAEGFDVTAEDYDPNAAALALHKCKLLVLRNAFDQEFIGGVVKQEIKQFVIDIKKGRTRKTGRTSSGEDSYLRVRESNRWEILLPEDMIRDSADDLLMSNTIMDILQHPKVLGETHVALHSASVMFAAPGAVGQSWHEDDEYLYEADSYQHTGIAGNDLPAYWVAVTIPLLDLNRDHGPTEYCVGSGAISGLDIYGEDSKPSKEFLDLVDDKTLVAEGSLFSKYTSQGRYTHCPPEFWRSPLLNLGDAALFDLQMTHRGGWNKSKDTRVVLFMTYSRYWYKDTVYRDEVDPEAGEEEQLEQQLMRVARFAEPSGGIHTCETKKECREDSRMDLTKISGLTYIDLREEQKYNDEGEMLPSDFIVSNKDVVSRHGTDPPLLFLNQEDKGAFPANSSIELRATRGDILKLIEPSTGDILLEWTMSYFGQVVFTMDMITD